MELLILLATKDGRLVTRDEIIERLWGKDVFVDTEHGINTAIRKIRLVLKDDPERPRFVQTVTGKGYRFVAERTNGNGAKSVLSAVEASLGPQQPVAVPETSTNRVGGLPKSFPPFPAFHFRAWLAYLSGMAIFARRFPAYGTRNARRTSL